MPKRGKSPLRIAMRALAVRKWSIDATKRAKSELEVAMAMATVPDTSVPFWIGGPGRAVTWRQFMYTRCQQKRSALHAKSDRSGLDCGAFLP